MTTDVDFNRWHCIAEFWFTCSHRGKPAADVDVTAHELVRGDDPRAWHLAGTFCLDYTEIVTMEGNGGLFIQNCAVG